jgi:hypothetical protein
MVVAAIFQTIAEIMSWPVANLAEAMLAPANIARCLE